MLFRCCAIGAGLTLLMFAQQRPTPAPAVPAAAHDHGHDQALKAIDNQNWFARLNDIAIVDEVRYTGPPPQHAENPTAPGAKNPVIIHALTFIPKKLDRSKKQPLLVFAH